MGKIIHPNGVIEKLDATTTYSLIEISKILGGTVDLGVIPGAWYFCLKFGAREGKMYNEKASIYVGGPIFGDCLIFAEHQLPSLFRFPTMKELMDETEETPDSPQEHSESEPQEAPFVNYDELFTIISLGDTEFTELSIKDKSFLLDKLMNYFIQDEQYERCQYLQRYQQFQHILESH